MTRITDLSMQPQPSNVNHFFMRVLNIGVNSITSSDNISDFFGKGKWKSVELLQLNGGCFPILTIARTYPRVSYAGRSLSLWMCYVMRSTARRESQARESAAMFRPEQLSSRKLKKSHCSSPLVGTLRTECI